MLATIDRSLVMPVKKSTQADEQPRGKGGKGAVDVFMDELAHPHKAALGVLRALILGADPSIGETIKWNAPSFHTAEHFATMNLRAIDRVELILHLGARKNAISETGMEIADPAGLLDWLAKDRARVRFADADDIVERSAAFGRLVRAWIRHIPPPTPPSGAG